MGIHFFVILILAVATGCGIGGGGLYTVYLVTLLSFSQTDAQAASLILFLASAISSSAVLLRNGNRSVLRAAVICSLAALPGVFAGTYLRGMTDEGMLRRIFAVFLISAGLLVFMRTKKGEKTKKDSQKDLTKAK